MHKQFLMASLALLLGSGAHATPVTFHTMLKPVAGAPATGTGMATLVFDRDANMFRIQIEFSGLGSPTTVAHIHCCTAMPMVGSASPATGVPTFLDFPAGVMAGNYDHTFDTTLASTWGSGFLAANGGDAEQAEESFFNGLTGGRAYLNIHTGQFPGGEIQGFMVPEPGSLSLAGLAFAGLLALKRRNRPAAQSSTST